jgi:hypothetical protein
MPPVARIAQAIPEKDGLPGYFGYLGPEIEEAGCSSWSTDRLGKTFHEPEPEHWQAARAR